MKLLNYLIIIWLIWLKNAEFYNDYKNRKKLEKIDKRKLFKEDDENKKCWN